MALVITPRLAGPLAVAIAEFRKMPAYGNLPRDVLGELAALQEELRLLVIAGRSQSTFDPDAFAAHAGRMTPLLLSYEEAGRLLACSASSVQRLVRSGDLQTVGEGRGMRVVAASLDAYVNRSASTGGEAA